MKKLFPIVFVLLVACQAAVTATQAVFTAEQAACLALNSPLVQQTATVVDLEIACNIAQKFESDILAFETALESKGKAGHTLSRAEYDAKRSQ